MLQRKIIYTTRRVLKSVSQSYSGLLPYKLRAWAATTLGRAFRPIASSGNQDKVSEAKSARHSNQSAASMSPSRENQRDLIPSPACTATYASDFPTRHLHQNRLCSDSKNILSLQPNKPSDSVNPFPFMSLPRELRGLVYLHYLGTSDWNQGPVFHVRQLFHHGSCEPVPEIALEEFMTVLFNCNAPGMKGFTERHWSGTECMGYRWNWCRCYGLLRTNRQILSEALLEYARHAEICVDSLQGLSRLVACMRWFGLGHAVERISVDANPTNSHYYSRYWSGILDAMRPEALLTYFPNVQKLRIDLCGHIPVKIYRRYDECDPKFTHELRIIPEPPKPSNFYGPALADLRDARDPIGRDQWPLPP